MSWWKWGTWSDTARVGFLFIAFIANGGIVIAGARIKNTFTAMGWASACLNQDYSEVRDKVLNAGKHAIARDPR